MNEPPDNRAGRLTEIIMAVWLEKVERRRESKPNTGVYNAAYTTAPPEPTCRYCTNDHYAPANADGFHRHDCPQAGCQQKCEKAPLEPVAQESVLESADDFVRRVWPSLRDADLKVVTEAAWMSGFAGEIEARDRARDAAIRRERDAEWCAALWPTNPEGQRDPLNPEEGAVWRDTLATSAAVAIRRESKALVQELLGALRVQTSVVQTMVQKREVLCRTDKPHNHAHLRELQALLKALGDIHDQAAIAAAEGRK